MRPRENRYGTQGVGKSNSFLETNLSAWIHPRTLREEKKKYGSGGGLYKAIVGDVPEMKVDLNLTPEARQGLFNFGAVLGGGMALDGLFRFLANKK